jgi:hypothetical protein
MIAFAGVIHYLKKFYEALKGKPHNEVLIPNNQGEFQQIIGDGSKILKDSKSEGNMEVRNCFSLFNIFNIRNVDPAVKGIKLSEEGEKGISREVAEEKEKPPSRKVNLIPLPYSNAYTHVSSKNKYTDPRILEIVNRLDKNFVNKIFMAIEIDELYKAGKKYEGDSDREDFSTQYGMNELKFVDLWTEGYLKKILIRLYEVDKTNPKTPNEIKKTIDEFVASAATIFFIHRNSDVKNVVSRILNYSSQNREYIALHALRSVVNRAKEIDKEVHPKLIELGYTPMIIADESREFSKVWYKGRGIETYKLLLEISRLQEDLPS